jgi:murein DD-endopeptidase MepM/ murein hydrolase activator NlpD
MRMRTPIIAARDGVVSAVRESNPDGTGRVGDENFLIIDHGDGEYSRYIHLTRNGALVSRGDRVARGDTIALSGDSGRSAFPHLHFDVVDGCPDGVCWTIPAAFMNSEPPIPTVRRLYLARPF